ncbi:hypothetical protein FPV67DRAFT_1451189 [Lyophyllum atratum]|nr:hypothetical protein FPV67DRAFT_1451189 [Lyophyllum atratum]
MTPLSKIPFILATTYAVTTHLKNPNTTLSDQERRPDVSNSTTFMRVTTANMGYIRGVFWVAAAAEIVTILAAQRSATSEPANCILKMLMKKGTVDDLRLTPLAVAGSLITVAGCWLRLKAFRTLKELYTFEITIRENHKLVTTGPYGVIRHPGYAAFSTVFLGLCCWFGGRGSWVRESGVLETIAGKTFVGLFTVMYTRMFVGLLQRMPAEDRLMKASFGEEWERWARQVPCWLIPGIY